jgi:hypothetical protein
MIPACCHWKLRPANQAKRQYAGSRYVALHYDRSKLSFHFSFYKQ